MLSNLVPSAPLGSASGSPASTGQGEADPVARSTSQAHAGQRGPAPAVQDATAAHVAAPLSETGMGEEGRGGREGGLFLEVAAFCEFGGESGVDLDIYFLHAFFRSDQFVGGLTASVGGYAAQKNVPSMFA